MKMIQNNKIMRFLADTNYKLKNCYSISCRYNFVKINKKMKKNFIQVLSLALLLGVTFGSAEAQNSKKDALTVIHNRKSVRSYTGKAVNKEMLKTLMKAGMAAPTAMNKQPWAFVAVTDRKQLNTLADSLPYAKMLYKAGAAIVVCGDLNKALPGEYQAFWVQDCSAATENILLAVEALGLGAVWTGVYPEMKKITTVKDILGVPHNVIPLNVIAIGYPSGKEKPKNKYKTENTHWNKW